MNDIFYTPSVRYKVPLRFVFAVMALSFASEASAGCIKSIPDQISLNQQPQSVLVSNPF